VHREGVPGTETAEAVLTPLQVRRALVPERARDAARYGDAVVFALDDRVWLEPGGFSVMGQRRPDVVIALDGPSSRLTLEVVNAPVPNRIRISMARWHAERALGPGERWTIVLPTVALGRAFVVNFGVESGARDDSGRLLGCRVSLR
jgi:hypothetical protein